MTAGRRILIVGMHTSVHVVRWARMIARDDVAVLIFPVYHIPGQSFGPIESLRLSDVAGDLPAGVWAVRADGVRQGYDDFVDRCRGFVQWRHSFLSEAILGAPGRLKACIRRFRPDLVHSMEVQLAGYLCLETARRMGSAFPPWLLSNWGSDIALFRKLPEHQERLRQVCRRIDFYLAECARDREIARDLGYRGPDLDAIPASGGADPQALAAFAQHAPSARRTLIVKGYHGWSGRAGIALSGVILARRHLAGYAIRVPLASSPVLKLIAHMRDVLGLDIREERYESDHGAAISRLAQARAVIGMGISDGISTTLLESMAVGAFPIQASTACADEWIECGRSGFIVPPHDARAVADAIEAAVHDDRLVDGAARINQATIAERWDLTRNAGKVWQIYERVLASRQPRYPGTGTLRQVYGRLLPRRARGDRRR